MWSASKSPSALSASRAGLIIKSIKSHDQQTFHEGNRYVPHMKYTWAWTWNKVWGHEMFHDDKSQM